MDVFASRSQTLPIALAASVTVNIFLLAAVLWPESTPEQPEVEPVVEAPIEAEQLADEIAAAEIAEEIAAEAEREPVDPRGIQLAVANVQGSIPQTMETAASPYGENVSATLTRVLAWDLDMRRDLRAGDKVEVAYSLTDATDKVIINAARYNASKFGKTIAAYRFQATGDKYPSYWSADGTEIPHRLKEPALREYEQVTSLLKDRPTHAGMDFKTDVGTEVLATRGGVVTRSNWNWKANGNCIEIKFDDGVLAKYLHLSENRVEPGARVNAGQVIALSGNTGRSTGPHLHYQLNQGKKVLDPIDYHGTTRRQLSDADKAAFDKVVAEANKRFGGEDA